MAAIRCALALHIYDRLDLERADNVDGFFPLGVEGVNVSPNRRFVGFFSFTL